jgi:DHA2 family multidrug resistance protein-like MFS transporter
MQSRMRAGRREWIGLGVLALPCLLYSMDLTVLYMAVPKLSADLHPSSVQLLWITDIYGFMLAGLLLTMGSLGDRIGRRRLLLIGAAAFAAASLLAAFSTSAPMLIGARALLGVAGATLAPSTLSLLHGMFTDRRQRTFAVGIWTASFSLGAAIGPLVGGALLEHFWWGSVFLVAVPVMLVLLVLGPRLLPEQRNPEPARLDLASAALSLLGVLGLIYALKEVARSGLDGEALAALVVGLAASAAFVRRQRVLADPLLDLRLFRSPALSSALGSMLAAVFVIDGTFLFLSQYLQLVDGKTPLIAAVWLLPATGGLVAGSMLAPVLTGRIAAAQVLVGGLLGAAAGVALLTRIEPGYGLTPLVAGSLVMGIGSGVVGTIATDVIVATAPPERAGAASAISETGAEIGGALGIAVLGSIGLAVYRMHLGDALPAGLTAVQEHSATRTLADATSTGRHLPPPASGQVLHAAAGAFTDSLQAVAAAAASVTLLLALLAGVLLRKTETHRDRRLMSDPDATQTRHVLDRNITALNARDIEAYLANQHPDVELRLPGGVTLHGRDELRRYTESQWSAFPDGTLSFGRQAIGADLATTELVFEGTHTGPMPSPDGEIPATGRRVSLRFGSVLEIRDGSSASERVYLDQLDMLTQLGLMPGMTSAEERR